MLSITRSLHSIALIVALCSLCSCRSNKVIADTAHSADSALYAVERASVTERKTLQHDSVDVRYYERIYFHNDTVYIEHATKEYRNKIQCDTLRLTDTIRVTAIRTVRYNRTITVERKLTAWERVQHYCTGIIIGAVIALVVLWIIRRYRRRS